MNGKEAADDDVYTVVMQQFFFDNIQSFLDVAPEEIEKNGKPVEVAAKAPNILEEYFKDHDSLKLDGEPRLIIRNAPGE